MWFADAEHIAGKTNTICDGLSRGYITTLAALGVPNDFTSNEVLYRLVFESCDPSLSVLSSESFVDFWIKIQGILSNIIPSSGV